MYLEGYIFFWMSTFSSLFPYIEFGFIVYIEYINQKFTNYYFYYRKAKIWFKF